jgi:hypothetical protein
LVVGDGVHVGVVLEEIAGWVAWQMLRDAGVAAPIDSEIPYYVLVGAASLFYVNAPEVRRLTGRDPNSPKWIGAHADGLFAMLLPGRAAGAD